MADATAARPPSVDRLLSILAAESVEVSEREALASLVRAVIDEERRRLGAGAAATPEGDLAAAVVD
ncbi:MAG TPA: hypothetical protein VFO73_01870, partial [Candidatus Limnocylindrales bacterium]|nr:hypothetical protein [Candidatus Limnocylindrales bacterium]